MTTFPPNEPANPRPAATERPVADSTQDERTYALLMHLSLLGHVVLSGVAVIIPLVMWLVKREESEYIDDHGKEALNFHLSLIIYSVALIVLGFVTCGITWAIAFVVYILGIVGVILASMAANRGEFYRYPMTIRLLH